MIKTVGAGGRTSRVSPSRLFASTKNFENNAEQAEHPEAKANEDGHDVLPSPIGTNGKLRELSSFQQQAIKGNELHL